MKNDEKSQQSAWRFLERSNFARLRVQMCIADCIAQCTSNPFAFFGCAINFKRHRKMYQHFQLHERTSIGQKKKVSTRIRGMQIDVHECECECACAVAINVTYFSRFTYFTGPLMRTLTYARNRNDCRPLEIETWHFCDSKFMENCLRPVADGIDNTALMNRDSSAQLPPWISQMQCKRCGTQSAFKDLPVKKLKFQAYGLIGKYDQMAGCWTPP